MATKQPTLPASTWRVLSENSPPIEVTAIFCVVNAGAAVFKDEHGNVVLAIAPGLWGKIDRLP